MDRQELQKLVRKYLDTTYGPKDLGIIAQKALTIGEVCAQAGYPQMALEVYTHAMAECSFHDWETLNYPCEPTWWHNHLHFQEVAMLAKRCQEVWKRYFSKEQFANPEEAVREEYRGLWEEKWEACRSDYEV